MHKYTFPFIALLLVGMAAMSTDSQAQEFQPLYRATFDDSSFELSGWKSIPSGTGEFQPASVSIGMLGNGSDVPGLSDGRGVIITALQGQGSLVYGPVIPVDDQLVLLRVSVHALSGGGSVAMGALDVAPGGSLATIDGSVTYDIEADSAVYTDDYQRINVIYRPKSQALIPVFQLAVNANSNASVVVATFDNFEIYTLDSEIVQDPALQALLGITPPVSTPTPTAIPTMPPEITPTPTPTPMSVSGIVTDWLYTLSPTDDSLEAMSPSIAFDHQQIYSVVAADRTGGFDDILLRDIDTESGEINEPVTVNETFEDTITQMPDITIDFGGTRHVVWSDNRSIEKLYSVYLTQIDSFGQRLVESDFEANILYEETNAIDPALSVRDNGDMILCWTDDRSLFMDVYARRVHWTGDGIDTLQQEDVLVNIPREDTNTSNPDVVMDEAGNVAIVWSDDRALLDESKRSDIYAAFFPYNTQPDEEGKLPETIQRIQLSDFDQILDHATIPKIALGENIALVVWQNIDPTQGTSSVHGVVADMNGEILQGEFVIDEMDDRQATSPAVTALNENLFMISWYDESRGKIYARIFNASNRLFLTDPTEIESEVLQVRTLGIASDGEQEFFTVWDAISGQYRDLFGASGRWGGSSLAKTGEKPLLYSETLVKAHHDTKLKVKKARETKGAKELRRKEKRSADDQYSPKRSK